MAYACVLFAHKKCAHQWGESWKSRTRERARASEREKERIRAMPFTPLYIGLAPGYAGFRYFQAWPTFVWTFPVTRAYYSTIEKRARNREYTERRKKECAGEWQGNDNKRRGSRCLSLSFCYSASLVQRNRKALREEEEKRSVIYIR